MGYIFDPAAVLTGKYLSWFIWGTVTTIGLTAAAWVLGMVMGILLTLVRMIPLRPLEWFVALYVEYHRNVPLLVQIFVWYFVSGAPFPPIWRLTVQR
jgi:polar amino acid transport system permease protein